MYLSLLFCSYFVVLCFLCFVVVLCIFIFVCTGVGLLPPGESPNAVSDDNNNIKHTLYSIIFSSANRAVHEI